MIISFFSSGTGRGAAPVDYLTAHEVLVYDENRNLARGDDGRPQTKIREPMPEVLQGNPDRTRNLIDASSNKWTYTAGVISFADTDHPSEDAQHKVIELFEALAFAGLETDQYDCLWVRHVHEGNVELHFCTPRLELATGKAFNIAPPGHEATFSSLRDLLNKTHEWADPMDPERARDVRAPIEAEDRANGREELHAWVLDQVSVGLITDRASMVEALTEAGFKIPRAGKAYLTALDPDTGERWRLKGEIFHESWQANPIKREAERGRRRNPAGARRIDGFTIGELQERYDQHCARRTDYNRNRYPAVRRTEPDMVQRLERPGERLRDNIALADPLARRGRDRDDDAREPVLDGLPDAFGNRRTGFDTRNSGQSHMADHGSRSNRIADLYAGESAGHVSEDRGKIVNHGSDGIGKRLAYVRRAVGEGLRNVDRGIERIRGALDRWDAESDGWFGRLRVGAYSLARSINDGVERIVERRFELQRGQRSIANELEATESRRREIDQRLENDRELSRSDGWSR